MKSLPEFPRQTSRAQAALPRPDTSKVACVVTARRYGHRTVREICLAGGGAGGHGGSLAAPGPLSSEVVIGRAKSDVRSPHARARRAGESAARPVPNRTRRVRPRARGYCAGMTTVCVPSFATIVFETNIDPRHALRLPT